MNKFLLAAVLSMPVAMAVAPSAQAGSSATIARPTTHTASMDGYYECLGGSLGWGIKNGLIKPSNATAAMNIIMGLCKATT